MPRGMSVTCLRRPLAALHPSQHLISSQRCYYASYGGGCGQAHRTLWLPRRLLLVRHGESEANVNQECYSTTPDWRIALTERGRAQAFDCGRRLRRIIGDEQLYIYYSPYARARQTLEEMRKSLSPEQVQGEREDERLREQEMGNYQPLAEMDSIWAARNDYGRLFYRFPSGESGADVGDRVSAFFDGLLRERVGLTVPNMNEDTLLPNSSDLEPMWLGLCDDTSEEKSSSASEVACASTTITTSECNESTPNTSESSQSPVSSAIASEPSAVLNDHNVLIVSHGLLIRLFVSRWFHVPMEVLETMSNPPNCAIVVLERDASGRRLVMTDVSKRLFGSDPLLQMMRFDGQEDNPWYRERYLGIVHPDRYAEARPQVDDDENHFSKSAAHNTSVGAPAPPTPRTLHHRETTPSMEVEGRGETDSSKTPSSTKETKEKEQGADSTTSSPLLVETPPLA